MIDFSKGTTTGTAWFSNVSLFTNSFGCRPNRYIYGLKRDGYVNFELLPNEMSKLRALYPNAIFSMDTIKYAMDKTSAVDEDDPDYEDDYGSDELYISGELYKAKLNIFDEVRHVFYEIVSSAIIIFYDNTDIDTFNPEAEAEKIISVLPLKNIDEKRNDTAAIDVICYDNGYYTINSRIKKTTVDIDKNYNDDFKPIYDNIIKFLDKSNRKSGVVILNGLPGTGKTTMIRHIITNVPGKYVLITPSIAAHMAAPELMSFLLNNRDCTFVLEDCETVIMDRETNSFGNAVASLLNMADGIMSDIFNGKFICTFNADIKKVDKALLRKGRCYGKYEFKKLDAEKAKVLLKERGFDVNIEDSMTLADIYNFEEKDIAETKEKQSIGFRTK